MSNSSVRNAKEDSLIKKSSFASLQNETKDIIISIILTESTTSLLRLDLPHLEDLHSDESRPTVCAIKAEANITETNYSQESSKLDDFTNYWFGTHNDKKMADSDKVSLEIAYFHSNPDLIKESIASLDIHEELTQERKHTDRNSISPDLTLKLKPREVYIRPLFTVRSIAHRDLIKSEANNLYITIMNSEAHMTESGWINVCRICHGGESIGDLLAPCHCRGSIALAHIECLERWLRESANSKCELCQHHFQIIRQPKYSVWKSIFVFLRNPGDHAWEILFDVFAFLIYTPAAIASTYMLLILCESITNNSVQPSRRLSAHIITFAAVLGMAAIDFTYSSWFMSNMEKHIGAWRYWYRNNCDVKIVLPDRNPKPSTVGSLEDEVD